MRTNIKSAISLATGLCDAITPVNQVTNGDVQVRHADKATR